MTPAGTFIELDVQNEWEESTHTLPTTTTTCIFIKSPSRATIFYGNLLRLILRRNLRNVLFSMCVCVYQPGLHRRNATQNFSSTFLLRKRALIFLARRIQAFLSLVDREVEFCVRTIYERFNRFPPVGYFYFIFFSEEKSL